MSRCSSCCRKRRQPYELVVNDIKKDLISGYVSAPKVQQPRGSQ